MPQNTDTPHLYPYQRAWIEDNSRFKIACKARQIGFTYAAAWRVVDKRLGEPGLSLWLSASERQALEAMEHVRRFVKELEAAALYEEAFIEGTSTRQHTVQFSNGSRIIALPSNPDTVRGFAGDIVLDEFAFHRDAEAIWRAAFAIATRGFQLEIISTPNGARGRYYELAKAAGLVDFTPPVHEAKEIRGKPGWVPPGSSGGQTVWSSHWVSLALARTLGFVVDVESLRAAIGDEESWQQEYCCRFLSQSAHYLPPELVVAAEHPAATTALPALFELRRAGPPFSVTGAQCPPTSNASIDKGQFGSRRRAKAAMATARGAELVLPVPNGCEGSEAEGFIPPVPLEAGPEAGPPQQNEFDQGTVFLSRACPEQDRRTESRGAVPNEASREAQPRKGSVTKISQARSRDAAEGFIPPVPLEAGPSAGSPPDSAGQGFPVPSAAEGNLAKSDAALAATTEGFQGNPRRVPLSPANPLYLGVDIGRHRDLTVLWFLEIENPEAPSDARTFITRGVMTLERTPFTQQRATLDALLTHRLSARPELRGETFLKNGSPRTPLKDFSGDVDRPASGGTAASLRKVLGESENTFSKGFSHNPGYAIRRCAIDASGMGAMLAEELQQKWGSRVQPVTFTNAVKQEMAVRVKRLLEDGRLKIPSDPAIRAALNSVKREVTQAGNLRFDAERTDKGGHADHFWALALALHSTVDASPSTEFVSNETRRTSAHSTVY